MATFYINFKELTPQILHTKFQDNQHTDCGQEVFKIFTIYRRGGHLGHVS